MNSLVTLWICVVVFVVSAKFSNSREVENFRLVYDPNSQIAQLEQSSWLLCNCSPQIVLKLLLETESSAIIIRRELSQYQE